MSPVNKIKELLFYMHVIVRLGQQLLLHYITSQVTFGKYFLAPEELALCCVIGRPYRYMYHL